MFWRQWPCVLSCDLIWVLRCFLKVFMEASSDRHVLSFQLLLSYHVSFILTGCEMSVSPGCCCGSVMSRWKCLSTATECVQVDDFISRQWRGPEQLVSSLDVPSEADVLSQTGSAVSGWALTPVSTSTYSRAAKWPHVSCKCDGAAEK